jgi:hypothetical protein
MSGTLLKMSKVWVKHVGMVKICNYILLDHFEMFQEVESGTVLGKQNLFNVKLLLET